MTNTTSSAGVDTLNAQLIHTFGSYYGRLLQRSSRLGLELRQHP
jgi:hypothetical protein